MVEVHASGVRPGAVNPGGHRIYHGFGKTFKEAEDDALAQLAAFLIYPYADEDDPVVG